MPMKQGLSSHDLQHILEVNKKAIEIHLEVEKQNEDVLDILRETQEKINDIDKAMFKLIAILSTIGVSTIVAIVLEAVKLFKH